MLSTKISILEDDELKDIVECREHTVRKWLWKKSKEYKEDLILSLLKELREMRLMKELQEDLQEKKLREIKLIEELQENNCKWKIKSEKRNNE